MAFFRRSSGTLARLASMEGAEWYIVFGMGNPGRKFARTRHNIGYRVVDELARRTGIRLAGKSCGALWGWGQGGAKPVVLVKPVAYVNRSGMVASCIVRHLGVRADRLIVVTDDVNLGLGRLRLRRSGSAGGHRGLVSIIDSLGSHEFPRLRVGVGGGAAVRGAELRDFVLAEFGREERALVDQAISQAADCIETVLSDGIGVAMNRFNQ